MINANKKRPHSGPSKEQKDHYSVTKKLDGKVKDPSSGKIGESYRKQEKAQGSSKSTIGGIGSDHENVSGLKGLAVTKSHSAFRNQDHATPGLHGGSPEKKGSLLNNPTVSKYQAYNHQAKASDGSSSPEMCGTEYLNGEKGSYLKHFKEEKYLRQGHNDDGYVPMGPSMDPMEAMKSRMKKPQVDQDEAVKAATDSGRPTQAQYDQMNESKNKKGY